jgi:osmotically-inducible protein OsmY
MSRKSVVKIAILCCSLLLFFASGSFVALGGKSPVIPRPTAQADCADAAIVKAIYKNLQTDANLKDQIGHINVSVKGGKVKLNGWASGAGAIAKAGELAKKASSCVKGKVNNKHMKDRKPISCPDGQKDCDGTCIDKDADCNLPPKLGD